MKVLFMANVPPNPNSGAGGTEYETIVALRKAGCLVDTVWRDEISHVISHPNLHNLIELPLAYRTAMLLKLRQGTYDVVHVNQPHGYLAALALAKRGRRSVFVHRSHGLEARVRSELRPWILRYKVDRRPLLRRKLSAAVQAALQFNNHMIARHAYGHIVSASECKAFLTDSCGVAPERIAVIPQSAPTMYRCIDMEPMTGQRLKKILYVGQFAFVKGPMVLAQAIEKILCAVPEATFTWVCDKHHHEDARNQFSDKKVLRRVYFLDWMSQAELMDVYDSHSLFVFPSFFEGFGKSFLEAMARGLVVVGSRNGGMKDVIDDGRTGFLVPTGDSEALATRCISLLRQPSEIKRLSFRAREAALRFSWDRAAAETLSFYEHLLQHNSQRYR